MQPAAYAALDSVRKELRELVDSWNSRNPYLLEAQEKVRAERGYEDYRVETAIVYNRALDDVGPASEIKVILVADNPGKKEQLAINNRYLVGQSGKLAEGWFKRELGIDFRRDVLILNKTPVHTPKTAELALLSKSAGPHRNKLEALLAESQSAMADLAWRLYSGLREAPESPAANGAPRASDQSPWPVLWVSGVGELRRGGLFEVYRDELGRRLAQADAGSLAGVWAFNHFSMNQFAVELKRKSRAGEPTLSGLGRIGRENRLRVFGL